MAEIKIPHGLPVRPTTTTDKQDAKIREAAKMYEKYFLGEMMKAMRSTVSPANEPSMAENIYSEQRDQQYVESWGEHGGVGLADLIYNQVQERFFNHAIGPRPHMPIPIDKGTSIKIDNPKTMGIPVLTPGANKQKDVSFLYEWQNSRPAEARDVVSPLAGEVMQSFQAGDDRQILKLAHDNGLVSTLSFLGRSQNLQPGDAISAGQKLGSLSPQAMGLTWQISQAET